MANKKGRLSNKEKDFITTNYKSKSVKFIASKLNRSQFVVDKFIQKLSFNVDENKTQEKTTTTSGDLFARNKERGVVVMTEGASMAADESKKKKSPTDVNVSPRYRKHIHKIKD